MSYIIWGIAVFLLDVMTKLVAELKLMTVDTIPLWENVFHLTYVENRGIAFGLFSDQRLTFILVTFALLFVLAVMFTKTENRSTWMRWGVTLIYGGALGNLVERMAKGYVVDFLDFRLIHFPVFNVADIAICVGAGLLMLHFLLTEGENNV